MFAVTQRCTPIPRMIVLHYMNQPHMTSMINFPETEKTLNIYL